MKTYNAKPGEIARDWYLVDAEGKTLGRLATQIADRLRGKGKPVYTPHVDTGDFVVVVNAEKIAVTGNKLDEKMYYRHSGYPGGLRERTLREQLERQPTAAAPRARPARCGTASPAPSSRSTRSCVHLSSAPASSRATHASSSARRPGCTRPARHRSSASGRTPRLGPQVLRHRRCPRRRRRVPDTRARGTARSGGLALDGCCEGLRRPRHAGERDRPGRG